MLGIISELATILWYAMAATGVVTWLTGAIFLCFYMRVTNSLGVMDDPYGDSLSNPLTDSLIDDSEKTVEQLIDDSLRPRARLQYIYRQICDRAGINHDGISHINDAVAEAVYDGRNIAACIDCVTALQTNRQRGSKQHV